MPEKREVKYMSKTYLTICFKEDLGDVKNIKIDCSYIDHIVDDGKFLSVYFSTTHPYDYHFNNEAI